MKDQVRPSLNFLVKKKQKSSADQGSESIIPRKTLLPRN